MQEKIVIGFTGLIACGKGTAAKYLKEKYGATTYRFSTMLRDALDRFYLPQTRENMVAISECLRQTFGQDLLAKVIAEDVKQDQGKIIVVEGIRRLPDIKYLREVPGFKLIKIEVAAETRYDRLTKRDENPDDKSKTYAQFLADHQLPTELTIPEAMAQADATINNSGSLADLYLELDKLINYS